MAAETACGAFLDRHENLVLARETPDQIHVVIQDVSPGDWGFGGQLVSERIAQKAAEDGK